jgi:hypothetical protein
MPPFGGSSTKNLPRSINVAEPVSDLESVRKCFVIDDGSLPGIELKFDRVEEIPRAFAFLRSISNLTTPEAVFWNKVTNLEAMVDSVTNAASLVVEGSAECFRIGIAPRFEGVELPELGIYIFADNMEIDWRMGSDWNDARVLAFFDLLAKLKTLFPSFEIHDCELEGLIQPDAFFRFWISINQGAP